MAPLSSGFCQDSCEVLLGFLWGETAGGTARARRTLGCGVERAPPMHVQSALLKAMIVGGKRRCRGDKGKRWAFLT